MSDRPDTSGFALPVASDDTPAPSLPNVSWQLQTRLVVRTKYLSEYVSVWEDTDAVDDMESMAAEVAEANTLRFRLAEPKESLAAEWVVLPAGVVNESVIRIQARRKGQASGA